jgi:hypothetical protein
MKRLGLAITLFAFALSAQAQTPQPRLNPLTPTGAQRGTTTEITLTGAQIGQTTTLLFEGTGIQVQGVTIPKDRPNTALIKVALAPDALPGVRAVRAVTKAGISDRQWFAVGAYPETAEQEPNNTRDKAQNLPNLPTTIVGKSDPGEDMDYYKFKGEQGKTYVCEVLAARMGSAFDSVVSIQDGQGRDLALNDDYYASDSFLTFTPKQSGDYYLVVRDLRYQGSGNHVYRITLGAIPHVNAIFPIGGAAGKPLPISLFGVNLPPNATQSPTPQAVVGSDQIALPLSLSDGTHTALQFATSDLYEMRALGGNDSPKSPQAIVVPCVLNGVISAPKKGKPDIQYFSFKGEKGKRLAFEVAARQLGSRLDAHIAIMNAQGSEITSNDDQNNQPDSRLEFTPPDTGTYLLQVRDLFYKGGEEYPYRLSIHEPIPDFRLTFTQDRLHIGQGGRIPVTVNVTRLNGFNGAIDLELQGLPAGVRCLNPPQIPALMPNVILVLQAEAGAVVSGQPFRLLGGAMIGKKRVVHSAQALETTLTPENNPVMQPREFPAISVMEGVDIVLNTSEESITLAQGESKEIVLKITRKAGFNAKIPLSIINSPAGLAVTFAPPEIPEKQSEAKVVIKAAPNTLLGEQFLVLQARTLLDDNRVYYHASVPIRLTITKK